MLRTLLSSRRWKATSCSTRRLFSNETFGDNGFDAPFLGRNKANYVQLSPVSMLKKTVHQYPNVACYVHGDIKRTWAEVNSRIQRLAGALTEMQIKKNDVVSIIAPNTPSIFEAHFAVPGIQAVLHSINTRSDEATIAFQLQHAGTKVLIVDSEHFNVIQSALNLVAAESPKLANAMTIVHVFDDPAFGTPSGAESATLSATQLLSQSKSSDGSSSSSSGSNGTSSSRTSSTATAPFEYEQLLTNSTPVPLRLPDDEWDAISLNYTSGTTGNPKGVVSHHRGAYLNSLGNVLEWNLPLFASFLWVVPMFHCNGWNFPWSIAAVAGTSYFLRQIRPEPMFDIIERHKVGYFAGAPVTMNTLLGHPQRRKFTHGVKCWVAGAPPPPVVIKRFESEIGVSVQCAYGLTESYGPIASHNVDQDWLTAGHSAEELLQKRTFLSCDGTVEDMRVLDPETLTPVPGDGIALGEVMLRGNVVMKGYLGNEKATNECFAGGWFHTGDLAVYHGNGRIGLKDRSKDIIISGGENISSIQVENRLLEHELVGEVAVVAMADERWGEVPLAFVVPRPGLGVEIVQTVAVSSGSSSGNSSHISNSSNSGNSSSSSTSTNSNDPHSEVRFGDALLLADGSHLTAAAFMAWSRTKMPGYETPKRVVFVDSLPKTSTGKTQKHVLRGKSDVYLG